MVLRRGWCQVSKWSLTFQERYFKVRELNLPSGTIMRTPSYSFCLFFSFANLGFLTPLRVMHSDCGLWILVYHLPDIFHFSVMFLQDLKEVRLPPISNGGGQFRNIFFTVSSQAANDGKNSRYFILLVIYRSHSCADFNVGYRILRVTFLIESNLDGLGRFLTGFLAKNFSE